MHAVWKGYIAFGLVQFPVKLITAIEPKAISFRLLCGECKTPLKYKRWCPKCKKEIPWTDTLRGLEITRGKFYTLTLDKLKELRPEKSDIIEIIAFIDAGTIDPILFNKHYYVVPESAKEKAYALFKEILSATAKAAIARIILHEKEHICMLSSYKKGILLTTLNYAYEVRDIDKIAELKTMAKLQKRELDLAKALIEKLYKKEFDISRFKDTFAEKLKEMIKRELKGERITIKRPKPRKKVSLMEALKASIER